MYGFIVYDTYSRQIVRIAIKSNEDLPKVEANQKAAHVSFYNPDICGCYLHEGNFYEDQEFAKIIEDPTSYKRVPEEEFYEEILEGDPRWIDPRTVERKTEQEMVGEIIQEVKDE